MLIKSNQDEIQSFLSDASYLRDGHAERVVLPETVEEVSEILANANRDRIPVTVSGATVLRDGRPFAPVMPAGCTRLQHKQRRA